MSWFSLLSGLQYKLLICLISIKPYHFKPITDFSKYSVKACKSTGDEKGGSCCLFQFMHDHAWGMGEMLIDNY